MKQILIHLIEAYRDREKYLDLNSYQIDKAQYRDNQTVLQRFRDAEVAVNADIKHFIIANLPKE